jgi:hypothetical protein
VPIRADDKQTFGHTCQWVGGSIFSGGLGLHRLPADGGQLVALSQENGFAAFWFARIDWASPPGSIVPSKWTEPK